MEFASSHEFLLAEMERLDLLLRREILRLRARYRLSLDEFRGLYVSDEQVDTLMLHELPADQRADFADLDRRAETIRARNRARLPPDAAWNRLASEFSLTPFEEDVLLLACAGELDLKYETVIAYLNNDVTRKYPTCELALRMFGGPAECRKRLSPEGTLFAGGILQPLDPAFPRATALSLGFVPAPAIVRFLLTEAPPDSRYAQLVTQSPTWNPESVRERLQRLAGLLRQEWINRAAPIIVFEGRSGSGRTQAAAAVCRELDMLLLRVDVQVLRTAGEQAAKIVGAIQLEQRLRGAALYVTRIETLLDVEDNPSADSQVLLALVEGQRRPVLLACEPGKRWRGLLRGHDCVPVLWPDPEVPERRRIWEEGLREAGIAGAQAGELAERFGLTGRQIRGAIRSARMHHHLEPDGEEITSGELFQAAQQESDLSLGKLAVKVNLIHSGSDLVLPPVTMGQVREIAAAVRHHNVVYAQWGFRRRIAAGSGLKVLFAGASGTGKTMAAGVIAREVGLALYKIDLSGVVSKFIGETEKNLDRIFRAAQLSNAILFFDEADALFGKRSEVKDAHDRYANIEVAYLLQKIEEHEGPVILASNLSKNIDGAFARRMHYVVEFPLPGVENRERLWRGMFPPEAPVGPDVDFAFLAKQFPISGGEIKNVVLAAAFLAVKDGRVISMKQVIEAMARHCLKSGRALAAVDFKQYHEWIESSSANGAYVAGDT